MFRNIAQGIKAYGSTFSLINKLGLWKYFAIPMAISLITATTIGLSAYGFSDNLGSWVSKLWPWEWGSQTFTSIAIFISALIIIAIGFVLYKHIVMALSAPFMSPVSEKIEAHLTGNLHTHRDTSFGAQLMRGIRINARNLLLELLLTIPILLLNFIPLIGSIAATVLLFFTQSYYAGFGNMDYTLERHFEYGKSINFVKQHRGYAIGNGMVFMLFLLLPIIGVILVLPLSVTAATKQTIGLLNARQNPAQKIQA